LHYTARRTTLSRRFSKAELLELAREIDAGFDVAVFVETIGLLSRYSDVDLDLGDVNAAEVRAFFPDWRAELKPGWQRCPMAPVVD
jgi:hypothetical protein